MRNRLGRQHVVTLCSYDTRANDPVQEFRFWGSGFKRLGFSCCYDTRALTLFKSFGFRVEGFSCYSDTRALTLFNRNITLFNRNSHKFVTSC
jgi:hypothetical protein